MQGKATKRNGMLLFCSIAAIVSIIAAPEGSLSSMLARLIPQIHEVELHPAPLAIPDIYFISPLGQREGPQKYKGKVVILNFWATWCGPCAVEKPKLNRLAGAMNRSDLAVISITSTGEKRDAVEHYLKSRKLYNLKAYKDEDSSAFFTLQLEGLPSTIILNKRGREVARYTGAIDWDSENIRNMLTALLREAK